MDKTTVPLKWYIWTRVGITNKQKCWTQKDTESFNNKMLNFWAARNYLNIDGESTDSILHQFFAHSVWLFIIIIILKMDTQIAWLNHCHHHQQQQELLRTHPSSDYRPTRLWRMENNAGVKLQASLPGFLLLKRGRILETAAWSLCWSVVFLAVSTNSVVKTIQRLPSLWKYLWSGKISLSLSHTHTHTYTYTHTHTRILQGCGRAVRSNGSTRNNMLLLPELHAIPVTQCDTTHYSQASKTLN